MPGRAEAKDSRFVGNRSQDAKSPPASCPKTNEKPVNRRHLALAGYVAVRGRLKIQATKMETIYSTNIGAANKSIFGMSLVGESIAAAMNMMIAAVFQERTRNPAVNSPIREST